MDRSKVRLVQDHKPNRSNPTGKTGNWKSVINALNLYYDDRITLLN